MFAIIFLIVLGLIWIIFASTQDLKHHEVANWLNFSLIIFAMGFRFFYSLFSSTNFNFFYQGLFGLGIFLILGNLFYYLRLFAGGDAKLMIALGTILPFSETFLINLKIFAYFLIIFLFAGAFYGLLWSLTLTIKNFSNFKKEFSKQLKKNKKIILLILATALITMAFGFMQNILFLTGILLFILPYFYIYAKAVDESCMIKQIPSSELVEGDWLYKNIKIKNKIIKSNWQGLNEKEIQLLKKSKKQVLIRQGIPFVPVFLITFIILLIIWF